MLKDPQLRPTAHTALEQWYKIRASLSVTVARWRLQKPEETAGERVVLNTVAAARQGMHNLKSLFRDQVSGYTNTRYMSTRADSEVFDSLGLGKTPNYKGTATAPCTHLHRLKKEQGKPPSVDDTKIKLTCTSNAFSGLAITVHLPLCT